MKTENFIFLIINIILLYILYIKNNKYDLKESFISENIDKNLIYDVEKISETENNSNEIKYILEIDDINIYTKNTLSENINIFLINIIKDIISDKTTEVFDVKEIERVYEIFDLEGNIRFVAIFFVYNMNHFNSNKLVIDFVINKNNYSNIHLNSIQEFDKVYPNILNRYDKKIYNFYEDSKDYLYIGGYLSEMPPEYELLELLDNKYKKEKNYSYLKNKSLDYSDIKFKDSNKKLLKEYTKLILPKNQKNLTSNIFCNKHFDNFWDTNGLPIQNLNEPNNCILHNSSESGNINIPNKYPTFPQTNIENSNYNWLIDPVRNNIIRQHGYVF